MDKFAEALTFSKVKDSAQDLKERNDDRPKSDSS